MADPGQSSPLMDSDQSSRKRKLKHPRTSHACNFCRKRKTRCSGEVPSCAACREEDIACDYSADTGPPQKRKSTSLTADEFVTSRDRHGTSSEVNALNLVTPPAPAERQSTSVGQSRRTSADLPDTSTFDNGLHIGPTSGVSFLYKWQEGKVEHHTDSGGAVPLASYGDVPLPRTSKFPMPSMEEGRRLVDHYFRFAMPTFRFFHQQTLERWMEDLVQTKPLVPVRAASVLIVWAQALIYSDLASTGDQQVSHRSLSYFEQARKLINNEPGPAQLASVESRLATCLYLLSVSHINECRFLFGYTHTLVIYMGLHRRIPSSKTRPVPIVEVERRKRAFWSFYDIDCYLSVMLGQPRQLRDEDIDQEYPLNIEDSVLDAAADLTMVPHHGNLEAFIYHSKLVRTFAYANDLLYPIEHLGPPEIVSRGAQMVTALLQLEDSLPPFLKPRPRSGLGTQTWERQNSVLGLALAHSKILATRRCLLVDTSEFPPGSDTSRHHSDNVHVCLTSICNVIDQVYPMVTGGRLLWGFWLTQYIAMCAISTLFVYKIQCWRGSVATAETELLPHLQDGPDLATKFQHAEQIQEYLSRIAPVGSQAKRHHSLLSKLRQRANKPNNYGPRERQEHQNGRAPEADAPLAHRQLPQSPLSLLQGGHAHDIGYSNKDQLPLLSSSEDGFTPSMMFDFAFPDASSWQFLDQLGSVPLQQDGGPMTWGA